MPPSPSGRAEPDAPAAPPSPAGLPPAPAGAFCGRGDVNIEPRAGCGPERRPTSRRTAVPSQSGPTVESCRAGQLANRSSRVFSHTHVTTGDGEATEAAEGREGPGPVFGHHQ